MCSEKHAMKFHDIIMKVQLQFAIISYQMIIKVQRKVCNEITRYDDKKKQRKVYNKFARYNGKRGVKN